MSNSYSGNKSAFTNSTVVLHLTCKTLKDLMAEGIKHRFSKLRVGPTVVETVVLIGRVFPKKDDPSLLDVDDLTASVEVKHETDFKLKGSYFQVLCKAIPNERELKTYRILPVKDYGQITWHLGQILTAIKIYLIPALKKGAAQIAANKEHPRFALLQGEEELKQPNEDPSGRIHIRAPANEEANKTDEAVAQLAEDIMEHCQRVIMVEEQPTLWSRQLMPVFHKFNEDQILLALLHLESLNHITILQGLIILTDGGRKYRKPNRQIR